MFHPLQITIPCKQSVGNSQGFVLETRLQILEKQQKYVKNVDFVGWSADDCSDCGRSTMCNYIYHVMAPRNAMEQLCLVVECRFLWKCTLSTKPWKPQNESHAMRSCDHSSISMSYDIIISWMMVKESIIAMDLVAKHGFEIFRALGCRAWKSRFVSDPTRQHKTWTVWISDNDCVLIEYNLNREGYVLALHWYSGFYPVFGILTASMKHDILAIMTALSCDPSPLHVTIHS